MAQRKRLSDSIFKVSEQLSHDRQADQGPDLDSPRQVNKRIPHSFLCDSSARLPSYNNSPRPQSKQSRRSRKSDRKPFLFFDSASDS